MTWPVVGMALLMLQGCAALEGLGKVAATPGVSEGLAEAALKDKHFAPDGPGRVSPLQASPAEQDFGLVAIASDRTATIAISNPADFSLDVVGIAIDGEGFTLAPMATSFTIPAHGQVTLAIAFQPSTRGNYSAVLILTVDSAGRFTRIPLKGRGM